MKDRKLIGYLLIAGAMGVFIPYTILTITFDYPDILRKETGTILTEFYEGGPALIYTWLAFALLGLPLLVAFSLTGQNLETRIRHARWITTIGIISIVVQLVGLLRWVFVVPVLAAEYVKASSSSSKDAIITSFKVIHQFGGVLLGEHIGQLFTVAWTIFISSALLKLKLIPKWMAYWGILSSVIYFLAQAELIATVIPDFPVIDLAGFLGSTLWLLWLILLGIHFITGKSKSLTDTSHMSAT